MYADYSKSTGREILDDNINHEVNTDIRIQATFLHLSGFAVIAQLKINRQDAKDAKIF